MTTWINVAKLEEFPADTRRIINVDGQAIIIFNLAGHFYAIEDRCSHDDSPLHEGELEGDEIICPWHGARFCLKTGEVTEPPAYEDIQTFPVRIENGLVQVKID
ncbi:MAG: rieske 2Fe-2S domain protein [Gammaproteobacteria bacterium]|jgi:3-phenylpropionate/trans-cinnamate dioxygenase ferredoxin subunit|nr:rieske 2Fe-2S domain protein [Gammaproteobacteria bacterium]